MFLWMLTPLMIFLRLFQLVSNYNAGQNHITPDSLFINNTLLLFPVSPTEIIYGRAIRLNG